MTQRLELHRYLPPPLIVLMVAGAMWLTARHTGLALPAMPGQPLIAVMIAGTGLILMLVAAWHFKTADTTINPIRPEDSTALVTDGIYRYSRNPIYVGDLLLLIAWGVYLGNAFNLVWLGVFIWLMNQFQIFAEEKALVEHFGQAFEDYRQRTRRWL